jgi:hypothetical protein
MAIHFLIRFPRQDVITNEAKLKHSTAWRETVSVSWLVEHAAGTLVVTTA